MPYTDSYTGLTLVLEDARRRLDAERDLSYAEIRRARAAAGSRRGWAILLGAYVALACGFVIDSQPLVALGVYGALLGIPVRNRHVVRARRRMELLEATAPVQGVRCTRCGARALQACRAPLWGPLWHRARRREYDQTLTARMAEIQVREREERFRSLFRQG